MSVAPRPTVAAVCAGLSGAAAAAGAVALVGWWAGVPQLTTVLPGLASMKPNTALCLLLLGLVLLRPRRTQPPWALVATSAVLVLAATTLAQEVTDRDLRVDRLVPFVDLGTGGARMSPATGVALVLLSASTLLQHLGRTRLARAVAGLAFLVGYVAVIGYVYGASNLYAVRGYTSVALHTALALTALSLTLLLRGQRALVEVLLADAGGAGRLVRGLLPFLLVATPMLGWLQLGGEEAGWWDSRFGLGLLVTTVTAAGGVLLLRVGVQVRESEVERATLLRHVVDTNRTLEEKVAARTAELSAARARLAAAFASSPLGTALTDADGVVEEVNRMMTALTRRSPDSLVGGSVDALFGDGLADEELRLRQELLAAGRGSYRLERRLAGEGTPCWVSASVAVVVDDGRTRGLLYQLEDVTARRLAEERAEHMALHDPLTDLPNRSLLLDRLRQALAESRRTGLGVGVLFIDLDRFKVVNDSMGHHAGDTLLKEVGQRLRRAARGADTVARLGGDEFVVVVPGVHAESDLLHVADTLRRAVAHAFVVEGGHARVDASIGVAFGTGRDDPELLLRQADQAMYRAKDLGRARAEVFDDDLRGRIDRRLDVELALHGAVGRGEVEAWYQPLVDLADGEPVAVEALVRWRRPGHGVVGPDRFVRVAEEVGLIREIGGAVLTQACHAAAALSVPIAVSVNVSPQQFVRDDFRAVAERALLSSGLAPERLWLELTESAVVEALDSAARAFQALRDLGVRIAIDDFGTGFSSFSHLRDFRVDLVKIDRSFVEGLSSSLHDRAIVEGIVRMAEALRLDVVAEGIETAEQRDLLRVFGCRYGQGFLYARPSPSAVPRLGPAVPAPRAQAVEREGTALT